MKCSKLEEDQPQKKNVLNYSETEKPSEGEQINPGEVRNKDPAYTESEPTPEEKKNPSSEEPCDDISENRGASDDVLQKTPTTENGKQKEKRNAPFLCCVCL